MIAAYEALVRRYPISGYSDNALFNAAGLADVLHERFGQPQDLAAAIRLYRRVGTEYPASSLTKSATTALVRLDTASAAQLTSQRQRRRKRPLRLQFPPRRSRPPKQRRRHPRRARD